MSRVVFTCGPAGSGKSTHAHALERDGFVRLSFDDEAWRRGIDSHPLEPAVRDEIEAELRGRLMHLIEDDVDVVLDFSFWSRAMRDDYRRLIEPTGITPETIYLRTPRAVALERVRRRANDHSDAIRLTDELAASYYDHFEPPTADEGPLMIIDTAPRPVIRVGTVDDADALHRHCYSATPVEMIKSWFDPAEETDRVGFVAVDPTDGAIATCTLTRHPHRMQRQRAEIEGFVIAARHRGSGLARRLVEHCADYAGTRWQADSLELSVRGGTHAEDAYRGLGFIEWARFPNGLHDHQRTYDDVRLYRPI
ncbi:GNAT family N-acetyltransferase [Microlunatus soli]|uniref:Predicted kinase n=1 Tax=Microlunatus soli TaxID=630515 RepID=A0A1H1MWB1_9ACTN|nr:GNAT family N-acetyltransferase [Microlunatus soli]SDR91161.1 Predicted kinase [Microlunatus soli]